MTNQPIGGLPLETLMVTEEDESEYLFLRNSDIWSKYFTPGFWETFCDKVDRFVHSNLVVSDTKKTDLEENMPSQSSSNISHVPETPDNKCSDPDITWGTLDKKQVKKLQKEKMKKRQKLKEDMAKKSNDNENDFAFKTPKKKYHTFIPETPPYEEGDIEFHPSEEIPETPMYQNESSDVDTPKKIPETPVNKNSTNNIIPDSQIKDSSDSSDNNYESYDDTPKKIPETPVNKNSTKNIRPDSPKNGEDFDSSDSSDNENVNPKNNNDRNPPSSSNRSNKIPSTEQGNKKSKNPKNFKKKRFDDPVSVMGCLKKIYELSQTECVCLRCKCTIAEQEKQDNSDLCKHCSSSIKTPCTCNLQSRKKANKKLLVEFCQRQKHRLNGLDKITILNRYKASMGKICKHAASLLPNYPRYKNCIPVKNPGSGNCFYQSIRYIILFIYALWYQKYITLFFFIF